MNFLLLDEITEKIHIDFNDNEIPYTNLILEIYNNANLNPNNYNLEDDIILKLIGQYYHFIHICYDLMKKYYLMAIDKGNFDAMINLGLYYQEINDCEQMKKYYLMVINNDITNTSTKVIAIVNLGLYYQEIEDYELMKKYFLMAIDKDNDNADALYYLGLYYQNVQKDYDLMKKYYLMAIDKGNAVALYFLASYYLITEKDYDLMKKYFLMAIDKDNIDAMYYLGLYYRNTEKDYDLMKRYFLMAIDKGNDNAMYDLGCYYLITENDYELMNKYYLMAVDKGNVNAMYDLGCYYKEIKDYKLMLKYFVLCFQNNDSKPNNILLNYFKNKLVYYNWLKALNNKNETIYKIIMEMNNITEVKIYLQKIYNNLSNIKECIICYDTNINIDMYCGHQICINCYCKIDCCYYKCKKYNNQYTTSSESDSKTDN